MKEMYLHPVTLIQSSSVRYWKWQGQNPRPKERTARLTVLDCSASNVLSAILSEIFLLSKNIMIASIQQIAMMLTRLNVTKPTMIQGVSLIGTAAHAFIQASTGLARQLRPS
eukprot:8682017-Ditylum_brightwellii.AAC.1